MWKVFVKSVSSTKLQSYLHLCQPRTILHTFNTVATIQYRTDWTINKTEDLFSKSSYNFVRQSYDTYIAHAIYIIMHFIRLRTS
jgi:hypothetical protein